MSEVLNNEPFGALLCSECLEDHGLSLDANSLGLETDAPCSHRGSPTGRKLDRDRLLALATRFLSEERSSVRSMARHQCVSSEQLHQQLLCRQTASRSLRLRQGDALWPLSA
jgi:hypothetical protein